MYYSTVYNSPLGEITLVADGEENLLGLWIEGQKYFSATIAKKPLINDDTEILMKTRQWLDRYFAGLKPSIDELSLKPIGGEFRQNVWKILCEIPYGEVVTYGDIAQKIAEQRNSVSMSAQAVGGAVGHNPISIIIPCHRVIGANKSLTGYAGGISKKVYLLEHEGIDTSDLIIPTKGTAL